MEGNQEQLSLCSHAAMQLSYPGWEGRAGVGFETPGKMGAAARAAWQCPSPSLEEIHCVGKKEAALKQGTGQGWEG